jgi:hypothetical protein
MTVDRLIELLNTVEDKRRQVEIKIKVTSLFSYYNEIAELNKLEIIEPTADDEGKIILSG